MKKIQKAVFPVAGMGTRFLPATKANPKEMLPIVDKPLIQYAVEEAISAGCTELIFVTGRNKRSIEDHFDKAYELETELSYKKKHDLLEHVRNILPDDVNCIYIRQPEALGLGHAVLCAQSVVGDEPFVVILADDLIDAPKGATAQLIDLYNQTQTSIVAIEEIPLAETESYGIVETFLENGLNRISNIIEKPKPANAPSNMAVVGRYVLTPAIFDMLRKTQRGSGGEIQLTDAIAMLMKQEKLFAHHFTGKRYDCGNKLGYLEATVAYGLKHTQLGAEFKKILANML
ncbi:MAG: UTP--glucose-1-phosphate uridylyltransferase GalU [Neisseria sp.]|uniref:UTP--glucose-1-phosphate uridylyltransferase GalU n=1 Tax=Neisseria sp. TaxID=192066 RepID=UPI0026DB5A64|nr:UTP--glucose-1-phosphate uridylyltransferase GalU [Neisseria sp.]MDO4640273.1 UTP--glucose-1-phosphate uridylyltransferase GalU [Neisseria sp.]